MSVIKLATPLKEEDIINLHTGQKVLLNGNIYTARDAAHKKMAALLAEGQPLPIDIVGQVIYYAGPCPTPPGKVIGSIGPTSSGRMDPYTPAMLTAGLKGMVGKGKRNDAVREACKKEKAVYFATLGGAAALSAQCVKNAQVVAWPELGAEAIYLLYVEDLPLIVVNDCAGGDLYEEAVCPKTTSAV